MKLKELTDKELERLIKELEQKLKQALTESRRRNSK